MRLNTVLRSIGYGALALATLEMAARIDDYVGDRAPILEPYTINRLFRPSPYGREGVPGARFGKWQMNSLGYRSPEIHDGRARVITFGASETFGLYETAGHEYPRLLAQRLDERQPRGFDVVNIAIPGMRIGRIGYLERAIEQTQARHVVVYPSPANYIGTTQPFCRQPSSPVASPNGLSENVRLLGKLEQQSKRLVPLGVQTRLRSLSIWWATRNEVTQARVPEATLLAMKEDLICVARTAQQRGAIPILVTHATYFGNTIEPGDEALLLAWRRFYPDLREEGFLDLEQRANDVIRAVAAQLDAPIVDAAQIIPRGKVHFADFVHFTDEGARMMGQQIASAIATCGSASAADTQIAATSQSDACVHIDSQDAPASPPKSVQRSPG